jgi:hypothetical protein
LIDSQNLYINRLLNKHKKQKQYSLGSPIVMLPVTVTIETKRQWKCLLCVYCLSDICIWITQIYILYTLRILVWYFTNSVFESSKFVWISHRNLYDYSMKEKKQNYKYLNWVGFETFIYLFNANINRDSSPTDYKFKYN